MLKVKVCGLKYSGNIIGVAALSPDYMGFIFYDRSPRFCAASLTRESMAAVPPGIIKTAVFVDESVSEIRRIYSDYNFDLVQLHGDESVQFCEEMKSFGIPVIKAFQIDDEFDFGALAEYSTVCDYFLFDTKTAVAGGSGMKFNWDKLAGYTYDTPVFLSGGIGPDDVDRIIKISGVINLHAVDINSRFETEPGLKDLKKVGTFIDDIRLQSGHGTGTGKPR